MITKVRGGILINYNARRFKKRSSKKDKIIIYNIRYGTGTDFNYHLPFPFAGCLRNTEERFNEISEWIANQNPDTVGLIETDNGSYRMNNRSQPEILASKINGNYNFCCKYAPDESLVSLPLLSTQGNAIVSSKKSKYAKKFFPVGMKKLALVQECEKYIFILVHMSLGYKTRRKQIQNLANYVSEARLPIIVAGDGNIFKGNGELLPLYNAGLNRLPCLCTWPSAKPRHAIDFVMHSKSIKIDEFYTEHVQWSDHLPLIFTVSI